MNDPKKSRLKYTVIDVSVTKRIDKKKRSGEERVVGWQKRVSREKSDEGSPIDVVVHTSSMGKIRKGTNVNR